MENVILKKLGFILLLGASPKLSIAQSSVTSQNDVRSYASPHFLNGDISVDEVKRQIVAHRQRLGPMATLVLSKHSNFFENLSTLPPDVRFNFLRDYIALHDLPKLMTRPDLEYWGYRGPDPFFMEIKKSWGIDFGENKPSYISDLNMVEKKLKLARLKELAIKYSLSQRQLDSIVPELIKIEWLVDVLDTKINRSEELGFSYSDFATEKYFLEKGEADLAHLSRLIEPLTNPKLGRCQFLLK